MTNTGKSLDMTGSEQAFLKLINNSIENKSNDAKDSLSIGDSEALISLAAKQNVSSLIYDALRNSGYLDSVSKKSKVNLKNNVLESVIRQITQTNEFLTLLLHAQKQGLDPIVIKGIVCRSLYPIPCLRPSVDEDILVSAEDTEKYHEFLLSEGLFADEADLTADERKKMYEFSYHRENSPTYLELHTNLFDPNSKVFGKLNDLFEGMIDRTVRIQVEDVSIRTLAPTDHLLFLILHAYKHFLYSGIGIRPICDIGLFADHYSKDIDWQNIREKLESVNSFYYAKALLRIIQLYLLPGAGFFTYIKGWDIEKIDVGPLLEDTLSSGVQGASSLSRLHSSNMTLQAAGSGANPGGVFQALRQSLFPPVEGLSKRYNYLKKAPFLLPLAWSHRMLCYFIETCKKDEKSKANNNAVASIRLGRERIRLLRQYRIIK